jgi:hypothetical protein
LGVCKTYQGDDKMQNKRESYKDVRPFKHVQMKPLLKSLEGHLKNVLNLTHNDYNIQTSLEILEEIELRLD